MMVIAANLIIRNEAKHLERCLDSLTPIVDQIVIVDTGSTDQSLEIASRYTSNIHQFTWCDDFSAARNFALDKTDADWILILDGDEYLSEQGQKSCLQLISFLNKNHLQDAVVVHAQVKTPGQAPVFRRNLFSNHSNLRFYGRAHEWLALSPDKKNSSQKICFIDAPDLLIHHTGVSANEYMEKQKYYQKLLLLGLEESEKSFEQAHYRAHLGFSYLRSKKQSQALNYLRQARLDYKSSQVSCQQRFYHSLLVPLLRLSMQFPQDQYMSFSYMLSSELTQYFPKFAEGWVRLGYCLFWREELQTAEQAYYRAKSLIEKNPIPEEVQKHVLGQIYLGLGRIKLLIQKYEQGHSYLKSASQLLKQEHINWHLVHANLLLRDLQTAKQYLINMNSSQTVPDSELPDLWCLLAKKNLWSPLEQKKIDRFISK